MTQHIRLGSYVCDLALREAGAGFGKETGDGVRDERREGVCSKVFKRKDLFTQHLIRMHCLDRNDWITTSSPSSNNTIGGRSGSKPTKAKATKVPGPRLRAYKAGLDPVYERCFIPYRTPPPASGCPYCDMTFEGGGNWDKRMEHLGFHFEQGVEGTGREDEVLRAWLVQEGLVGWDGARGAWLVRSADGAEEGQVDADADGEEVER